MRQHTRRSQSALTSSLTDYLDAIGRYPLLNREEELALGRRIRAGDGDAVNQLVCANLRFVVSIAKQHQREGVALLDLIDEGNLGLIRAAEKYDETRGIRFISYAVWWIRQAILQAAADQSRIIRLPARRAADLHRIGRRASALVQRLGREPSQQELAEDLHVSVEEVASTLSLGGIHLSLDAAVSTDENPLLDYLPDDGGRLPDDEALESSRMTIVSDALAQLRQRDARILRMYFGFDTEEPMTLEQIGSRLGVTRERVRQIRDRALRRLRKTIPTLALAG